ncbi:MAG: molybdenum cofactor biosynthesis protein MoaE, partial [Thermoplasmata archaeon]
MSVVLSDRPLRSEAALRELSVDGVGGMVVFHGVVRPDRVAHGTVRALLYETHVPPAMRTLEALGRSVARRHGVYRWLIWHRFGAVKVGQVAVIIGAAAPHRRAAFEAVRELIDRVKDEVPL